VLPSEGWLGPTTVPGQFEFVPPPTPRIPFPAVTVPRVSDSFAFDANTATLESPATLPSIAVNPTSWNTMPVVIGPVTVSAVPGAAALLGVATVVVPLAVYTQPLLQSRLPYTTRPSSAPVSVSCSL
jgi:hypothetical protein